MSMLNRRNALTAVATLPALAGPAALAVSVPDPIYAAIEARRLTLAKWRTIPEESEEEFNAAGDTDCDAIEEMLTTVPTTLAGVLALLRYVVECEDRGDVITGLYVDDAGKCGDALLLTLHTAIERFCAAA